jgi:hypothetical protein
MILRRRGDGVFESRKDFLACLQLSFLVFSSMKDGFAIKKLSEN